MGQDVKLDDVAREAGVSIATASRALSGASRVSPETVRHVTEVARRLGYRVDKIARAMRAGTTRTAGMVVPIIANPFFAELVGAVEGELHKHDFELLLADSQADVEQEAKRLNTLVERRVDGIFVVSQDSRSATAVELVQRSVPIVQVDRSIARIDADFVGIDNEMGVAMVLRHLAELGARSVVLVSADDANSVGRSRRRAFQRVSAELGLSVREPVIGAFDVDTGSRAAGVLLERGELPDAVVTGSDLIAFGVIAALREAGREVPGDVLVTGYDGNAMSGLYSPPLTTVHQPLGVIAREAVMFLMERLKEPGLPPRRMEVRPELIVRRSTDGAPPRSAPDAAAAVDPARPGCHPGAPASGGRTRGR
ncbi:LacI family DNA-binding transcriptional regulator [Pseudonocardia ailaonensis]|uniref:LacI family DNA-binding transcriptional regulator n=1 Tax=Pseudonocardia ailaonensis TaxID=367279 RepID=A0ABN2NLJ7_9PSEU